MQYHQQKRLFDVVISLICLFVLAPVFVIIAILIKSSSRGTIFYTQTRVGKDHKHFTIYKFRSMYMNADTSRIWSSKNDNRAYSFGKVLRKSHLDELPQLINIIKGEMSLVSPRPERPMLVEKFKKQIKEYDKRLVIKPGLTGLAQVSQRADETIADVKRKLEYDLQYIEKQSIWYDIQIMLRTPIAIML